MRSNEIAILNLYNEIQCNITGETCTEALGKFSRGCDCSYELIYVLFHLDGNSIVNLSYACTNDAASSTCKYIKHLTQFT